MNTLYPLFLIKVSQRYKDLEGGFKNRVKRPCFYSSQSLFLQDFCLTRLRESRDVRFREWDPIGLSSRVVKRLLPLLSLSPVPSLQVL